MDCIKSTINVNSVRVVLIQTYLNTHVLNLFRALATGAQVDEFEQIIQTGFTEMHAEHDVSSVRDRCRLVHLSLVSGPFEKIRVSLLQYMFVLLH
jgi:hypothetical protein